MPEIELSSVTLGFGEGPSRVLALKDISASFVPGIFNVIAGPSGSGKTSLLSILGALITPDTGIMRVSETDICALSVIERNAYRRAHIGYVFQSFRLMRSLSAEDNILLSLEVRGVTDAKNKCQHALDMVELSAKANLTPDQMSGGEQQRVAIARAIAHEPSILLADEPTANLDSANGMIVTRLLSDLAKNLGGVVIVVSHDARVFPFADRLLQIEDGRIVGDKLCCTA